MIFNGKLYNNTFGNITLWSVNIFSIFFCEFKKNKNKIYKMISLVTQIFKNLNNKSEGKNLRHVKNFKLGFIK